MPTFPTSNKCEFFQCKNAKAKGAALCEIHGGKPKVSSDRLEANRAYKHKSWESIRATQLSKQPLCQSCLLDNRVTMAGHVDHLFPWRSLGNFAFTRNKFQSLCVGCHSLKTASERKGLLLHFAPDGVKTYTINDYYSVISDN